MSAEPVPGHGPHGIAQVHQSGVARLYLIGRTRPGLGIRLALQECLEGRSTRRQVRQRGVDPAGQAGIPVEGHQAGNPTQQAVGLGHPSGRLGHLFGQARAGGQRIDCSVQQRHGLGQQSQDRLGSGDVPGRGPPKDGDDAAHVLIALLSQVVGLAGCSSPVTCGGSQVGPS